MDSVPSLRIRALNEAPERPDGAYVLYWMVTNRRLSWNFALDHAVGHARRLRCPLLILEPLRVDYPWASARHHAFVLDGMLAKHTRFPGTVRGVSDIGYYPYVEPVRGAARGLLEALASPAAVVVTDEFPAFFIPRMQAMAASRVSVRMECVDANGLLPLQAVPKTYPSAFTFRRFLQRELPEHLHLVPAEEPLAHPDIPPFRGGLVPAEVFGRWPPAEIGTLRRADEAVRVLPIDQSVRPVGLRGGSGEARTRLSEFLNHRLARYAEDRNHPDRDPSSGLSPYLHFGYISAHEVFWRIADHEGWTPTRLSSGVDGKRHGWWGMSPSAEAFLDQLVTWRELGFSFCRMVPEHERYDTLPAWARETLAAHLDDRRAYLYSLSDLEGGDTHDPVWNAAQRQLRDEGTIHNYLRMLWGKKILEWSAHPEEALDAMTTLNNRFALDGRDPNSSSGISWVLGRFDRGWPERPIYGKVRSMSSAATVRKVNLRGYLERWS